MAFGIAAPLPYEVIGHGLLFVDIAIANTFLHYPDYVMMFLLGIPLYIGICVFDVAMEKTYRDQVALKLKLEDHPDRYMPRSYTTLRRAQSDIFSRIAICWVDFPLKR